MIYILTLQPLIFFVYILIHVYIEIYDFKIKINAAKNRFYTFSRTIFYIGVHVPVMIIPERQKT